VSASEAYDARRSRVAMQVVSRWKGDDFADDDMLTVIAAADMTFRNGINDLDWEAATLASLEAGSEQ
jgi:hypothetical protein